jgi:hypothetical protein
MPLNRLHRVTKGLYELCAGLIAAPPVIRPRAAYSHNPVAGALRQQPPARPIP